MFDRGSVIDDQPFFVRSLGQCAFPQEEQLQEHPLCLVMSFRWAAANSCSTLPQAFLTFVSPANDVIARGNLFVYECLEISFFCLVIERNKFSKSA